MPTREEIQKKGEEMGRCPCSMPAHPFPCPCKFFINQGICHCAGEKHEGFTQQEWVEYNLSNNCVCCGKPLI